MRRLIIVRKEDTVFEHREGTWRTLGAPDLTIPKTVGAICYGLAGSSSGPTNTCPLRRYSFDYLQFYTVEQLI